MEPVSQKDLVVKCIASTIRKKPSSLGAAIIDFVTTLSYEEIRNLTNNDQFLDEIAKSIQHVFGFLMLNVPSATLTPSQSQGDNESSFIEEEDNDEEEEEEGEGQINIEGTEEYESEEEEKKAEVDKSELLEIVVEEKFKDGSVQGYMRCPICSKRIIFHLAGVEGVECLDIECISSRIREKVLDALVKHPQHESVKVEEEKKQEEDQIE